MTHEDPFDTAKPAAAFPSFEQLAGRLVIVKPVKLTEGVPSQTYKNPDGTPTLSDRVDADITLVDGELVDFPGVTEWKEMWVSASYVVRQIKPKLATGGALLGRLQLKDPRKSKGQGNPWGLETPTEADVQTARDYLAGKRMATVAKADDNPFA